MIRKANSEDIQQLAELFSQLHRHHVEIAPHKHRMPREAFFSEKMKEILSDSNSAVLVNDDNGINAYAVIRILDFNSEESRPRKVCFIDCFAVAENSRRKGIGTVLFQGIKGFAREIGCNAVQLGVDAKNEAAKSFYKKMGLAPRSIIMSEEINQKGEQPL